MTTKTWAYPGGYSRALSKGYSSTPWIFDLHASPHDFDASSTGTGSGLLLRKVFSVSISHSAVVLVWFSGMHFHGGYFSNYGSWLMDPLHVSPSAQTVSEIVGQGSLNSGVGGFSQGIHITSGVFSLWRSSGIYSIYQLKSVSIILLLSGVVFMSAAYFHVNYVGYFRPKSAYNAFHISIHHVCLLLGLGSVSWSGHQVHVSVPLEKLIDSGIDTSILPSPSEIIFRPTLLLLFPNFGVSLLPNFEWGLPKNIGVLSGIGSMNSITGSFYLVHVAAHHFYVGVIPVTGGLIGLRYFYSGYIFISISRFSPASSLGHGSLSVGLGITGSLSIMCAHHLSAMPVYPFMVTDYPTTMSSFVHHV